jgi:long-chain acyl-CoA synthetase
VLFAPRIWEAIAADVRARVMDSSAMKQSLYETGMKAGLSALEAGKKSMVAETLVFRALRDRLGFTRLRSAATGGAALGPDTFKFFRAMGVPLRSTARPKPSAHSPARAGCRRSRHHRRCHGREVEIEIRDPDVNGVGEIVVRHPNMFSGYYKNEAATSADMRRLDAFGRCRLLQQGQAARRHRSHQGPGANRARRTLLAAIYRIN